ncbi:hypothetical protein L484_013591 [Morus notabilis]|uniref:Uncharacterized protein n=1 Tax=Morus notabilis TaxID=981085 RepID=W9QEX8_9ROSA|nr:hypothetical protein L484_013591 [Morus notabilis]
MAIQICCLRIRSSLSASTSTLTKSMNFDAVLLPCYSLNPKCDVCVSSATAHEIPQFQWDLVVLADAM